MNYNFKDDYLLLQQDEDSFNSKIKKQKKIWIVVLFIILIVFSVCFIYRNEIKSIIPNFNLITITSKDWMEKISLMKKNTKYRWPNSCPKWYHIPTAYERRKLWKLWCENHKSCDANGYIWIEGEIVGPIFLWYEDTEDGYKEIKKFLSDVNIHLDRHFDMGAWFYKNKKLWIKNNNSYCNALNAYDYLNGHASFDVDYYNLVDCNEPKYVRCFSDENITSESTNEESFTSDFGLERTKFEIYGTSYSWRKVTKMPRWDVVIPDSFVWIPIIEVWGWLYGGVTSVKLWENIIKIDDHAFASNGIWIKEIEFPDSVLYIWDYAFLNNKLTSVKFSNNLLYIWEHAFDNNKLTSIKLPDTVKFIGTWAFWWNEISSFHFPSWIKEISPEILRNNNLETIIIPEWVEVIGDLAFYANDLVKISLPQSLKIIWKQAFSCNDLTNVILPESVETIWKAAFCWNGKGRDPDFKGGCGKNWCSDCTENGYIAVKWYSKNADACININPFKSCRDEEENWVCWKNWWEYRNPCQMKANWDEEDPDYEYIDWRCRLKKDHI